MDRCNTFAGFQKINTKTLNDATEEMTGQISKYSTAELRNHVSISCEITNWYLTIPF